MSRSMESGIRPPEEKTFESNLQPERCLINPKTPRRLGQRDRQQDDRQEQDGKKPCKSISQN